jgi:signal transduction histidine kinase
VTSKSAAAMHQRETKLQKEHTRRNRASLPLIAESLSGRFRPEGDDQRDLNAVDEAERRRIARNIHDNLGQQVTALRIHLEALHGECSRPTAVRQRLKKLEQIAQQLDMSVDRLITDLRPPAVDSAEFPGASNW